MAAARQSLWVPDMTVDPREVFREFNARVNRLANALLADGLTKGDKVATVLPNCLEQIEVYWAAAKTGLVAVPMSPLLQESGLASLLENSDSALVISTTAFAGMLDSVRERGGEPAVTGPGWPMIIATTFGAAKPRIPRSSSTPMSSHQMTFSVS